MQLHDAFQPGTIFFRNCRYPQQVIEREIENLAKYLDDHLVSASPFIHLYTINHLKSVHALLAISRIGKVAVIIDPRSGRFERDEIQTDVPAAASIIINKGSIEWNYEDEVRVSSVKDSVIPNDDLDNVAILIYTAADDGYQKAAKLTHENLIANARAIASGNNVDNKTVSTALLPFSHLFGLQTGVITPLLHGSTIHIAEIDTYQNLQNAFDALHHHAVTHLYSIPALFYLLYKQLRGKDCGSLESCISGGYALKMQVRERFEEVSGVPVRQGYGLTEASPVCSWVFPGGTSEDGCIGRPIAGCEMKIVGECGNGGCPCSYGEIVVRGNHVMKGYFNRTPANTKVFSGGWMLTGDIGWMNQNGEFYLTSTRKRMINHSGMKVYPAEVERMMMMHENTAAVHVYGCADDFCGERVACNIALHNDDELFRKRFESWLRITIADYKVPGRLNYKKSGDAIMVDN